VEKRRGPSAPPKCLDVSPAGRCGEAFVSPPGIESRRSLRIRLGPRRRGSARGAAACGEALGTVSPSKTERARLVRALSVFVFAVGNRERAKPASLGTPRGSVAHDRRPRRIRRRLRSRAPGPVRCLPAGVRPLRKDARRLERAQRPA
jgi:hypothetical protein